MSKKNIHYFTLEPSVEKIFLNYLKNNYINKSKLIEGLIVKFLEEKNELKRND